MGVRPAKGQTDNFKAAWRDVRLARSVFLCLFAVTATSPDTVGAEAFRIIPQSASAEGQANAFAAQADDPSAIHYNPAGMTQLHGLQFSIGTNLVGGSVSYTSPTGVPVRGDVGGSVAIPPPSNLYITGNLKDLGLTTLGNIVLGLGVTSPFGLHVRYPNNGPFSSAITSAQLPLIDIKPTVAFKLNEQLSFGVGADIYTFASFIGKGQFDYKFNNPGIPGIPPGTPLEINGNDTAAGFNVSLLYTPLRNAQGKPLANIGLVYRSQATLHLNGQFMANGAVLTDARSTAVLPQIFSGGVAIWPVRDADREWKLEMDIDYVGWKSFRNFDVHLSNGATLPFPQNWKNSIVLMFGTEHRWLQMDRLPHWEVAVRGGYIRSQTPIPDATFNPIVPESDFNGITVGLGLLCKQNGSFLAVIPCGGVGKDGRGAIGLDLAYQAQIYESRTITGNINPTVDGTYRTMLHIGSVNLRVNF
ncbi:MAG TPA: outer membrane protein transport protein [Nitrospira sp.]|nr:outer membrane protein transport protein [Nitrospira sp.]